MTFQLKTETKEELLELAERYPDRQGAVLPSLRLLERDYGEIRERGMRAVAEVLGVPASHVWGVYSFYTHYRRPGEGKFIIEVCSTLPCALRGSESVYDRLSKHLGLKPGETTEDGLITLKKAECVANCDHGPCLQINGAYVDDVTPDHAVEIVEELRRGEKIPAQKYSLHSCSYEPVLLKHVQEENGKALSTYQGHGGYETAKETLTGKKPEEVIEIVKASGLRGRGGAGFPTGMKWGFTAKGTGKPVYLVCNADESEPGTFKDKLLIERDPHQLLEGILIAAYAVGSHDAFIYIRGEMVLGAEILNDAIREAEEAGCLGKNACGTGWDLRVTVHRGGGAYVCGEETGLLSSLEGKRGYPKIKPPFPAVEGAWHSPTIVNNVETLCYVTHILRDGAEAFRKHGTEKSPGTKILCVSGNVVRPGNYEVPLGIPLKEVIYDLAGGIPDGRKLKAVIPGGSSSPVLRAEDIEGVDVDFESIAAAGSMLGSGGVIVMDDRTCMVDGLWNLLRFYHHESCGQCTPCREGMGWLERLIGRIEQGKGKEGDVDLAHELARNMCGRTVCVLADAGAMPVQSHIEKFREEFEEHIRLGRCPMKDPGPEAKA